jgi:hypothetical protein
MELIAIRTLLYAMHPNVQADRRIHSVFRMRLRGGEYAVVDRLTLVDDA